MKTKTTTTGYYTPVKIIAIIVGLAFIIFFRFLPAPSPITPIGMTMLGIFIGLIIMWSFVDTIWPSFLAIIAFGFVAFQVYPNSTATAAIYEASNRAMGNWFVTDLICLLMLCYVLKKTGLMTRITMWFLNRKVAKKSAWGFTFMFFVAVYVISLFTEAAAATMILWALSEEIFAALGMTKEDKWTRVITIGLTFMIVIVNAATPICHAFPLIFMGVYTGITGVDPNWVQYMCVAVPVCTVIALGIYAFFRFIVKPDVSKLANADFTKIAKMQADMGKMSKREIAMTIIAVCLIIMWILPSVLAIVMPGTPFTVWMNSLKATVPLLAAMVAMCVIRIEGKPLLNVQEAIANSNFTMVFFVAAILMMASALGEPTTGVVAWMNDFITPIVSNMGAFGVCAIVTIMCIVLTNFTSNVTVGVLMMSVGMPIAIQMGINPLLIATCVCIGSNAAYCLPSSIATVGLCYSNPYGGAKYIFTWGLASTVISIVVAVFGIYGLGKIFFV